MEALDIIKYVVESPHNSNRNVLKTMLETYKTLSGIQIDIEFILNYVDETSYNTNPNVLFKLLLGEHPIPEIILRTVLYNDGTFIINEPDIDSEDNEEIHGAVVKTYPPLNEDHHYIFSHSNNRDWNAEASLIRRIEFGSPVKPTSLRNWFKDCTNLTEFKMTNLNTSQTTDMTELFRGCTSLTEFNLAALDLSKTTSLREMFSGCSNLVNINLTGVNTSKVQDFIQLFNDCTSLVSLDLSDFSISSATFIASMFSGCSGLTEIDVSKFDTSNVQNMSGLFKGCTGLTELDLSNFKTATVATMTSMFNGCINLETIYASEYFTTDAVINSNTMFYNCNAIVGGEGTTYDASHIEKEYARIDSLPDHPGYFTMKEPNKRTVLYTDGTLIINELEDDTAANVRAHGAAVKTYPALDKNNTYNFDTAEERYWHEDINSIIRVEIGSKIQPISTAHWFRDCSNCISMELSKMDTSKTTLMGYMFYYCEGLETLDLSSFSSSAVVNAVRMFGNCSNIKTIYAKQYLDFSALPTSDTSMMFNMCMDIKGGYGTAYNGFQTNGRYGRVDTPSVSGYFTEKIEGKATILYENGTLVFNQPEEDREAYVRMYGQEVAVYPAWSESHNYEWEVNTDVYWYNNRTLITLIEGRGSVKPVSTSYWFDGCTNLTSFSSNGFEFDEITTTSYMFRDCKALETVDIVQGSEGLLHTKLISMNNMFAGCTSLTSCNIQFNTSSVKGMGGMFQGCTALTELDLSNFDTSSVTSMSNMFSHCTHLQTLTLDFDTSNVENMNSMFSRCNVLQTINGLEKFNTSKVTDMERMFTACGALVELNLSSFNTIKVSRMFEMFADMTVLRTIYVNGAKFTTSALSSSQSMFRNSSNLVGGAGTTYDSSKYDSSYAVVDNPPGAPGYFTEDPYAKRTVLYSDGTLIINELLSDAEADTTAHGEVVLVMPPLDEDNNYVFANHTEQPWYTKTRSIDRVQFGSPIKPTSMRSWFRGCTGIKDFNWTNLDTSAVVDMDSLFFRCASLTQLDLTSFNTSKVEDMGYMFSGCASLTSVDLTSFNTHEVEDMGEMFINCGNLTELDLSSFSRYKLATVGGMFNSCANLSKIYASPEFDLSNLNSGTIFEGCTNLVGGEGTAYDSSHIDTLYGHIDGGVSDPGYFTALDSVHPYEILTMNYFSAEEGGGTVDITKDTIYPLTAPFYDVEIGKATFEDFTIGGFNYGDIECSVTSAIDGGNTIITIDLADHVSGQIRILYNNLDYEIETARITDNDGSYLPSIAWAKVSVVMTRVG